MDQSYSQQGYAVPGTSWPSPAVGMTTYQPVFLAAESSGLRLCNVHRNGYVQQVWHGRK